MKSSLKCRTKAEWKKNYPKEYRKAWRLGILPGIYKEMGWSIPRNYDHLETAEDFAEHIGKKFTGLRDWQVREKGSYARCVRLKLTKKVAAMLGWVPRRNEYPFKTPQDWAKYLSKKGFTGYKDWYSQEQGSYGVCCKLKIQREVGGLMGWETLNNYSALKTAKDWAKYVKELGIIGLYDWGKKSGSSYTVCVKLGLQREVAKILGWKIRGE